jgi:hypothetical protein
LRPIRLVLSDCHGPEFMSQHHSSIKLSPSRSMDQGPMFQCEDYRRMSGVNQFSSAQSPEWNSVKSYPSSTPTSAKETGKSLKKMKSEDSDSHYGGDDDLEIDTYLYQDVHRIPVKVLRKIVPKLRIASYYSELQVGGKKKLKHLWDEKPADWPDNVPFKDPNNSSRDVKKPGKDELGPMFDFLMQKYKEQQKYLKHQPSDDNQFNRVMAESSPNNEPFFCSSVSDNPALHIPQLQHSMVNKNVASVSESYNPFGGGHYYTQNTSYQPELDLSHSMSTSLSNSPSTLIVPGRISELHERLAKKMNELVSFVDDNNNLEVRNILYQVNQEVMEPFYNQIRINSTDKQFCLMYLDAGHQLEALLDVMFVLEEVDMDLMRRGCQEIVKKFKREDSNPLMCFTTFLQSAEPPNITSENLTFPPASLDQSKLTIAMQQDRKGLLSEYIDCPPYSKSQSPPMYRDKIFGTEENGVEFQQQSQLELDISDISQVLKLRDGGEGILERQIIEKRTVAPVLPVEYQKSPFDPPLENKDSEMMDMMLNDMDLANILKDFGPGSEQVNSFFEPGNFMQDTNSVQPLNYIPCNDVIENDVNLSAICQNMGQAMDLDDMDQLFRYSGIVVSQESMLQPQLSQLVPSAPANVNVPMIPAHVEEAIYSDVENDDDLIRYQTTNINVKYHRSRGNKDGGRFARCTDGGGHI